MKTIRELFGDKAEVTKYDGVIRVHRDDFVECIEKLEAEDGIEFQGFKNELLPVIGAVCVAKVDRVSADGKTHEYVAMIAFAVMESAKIDGNSVKGEMEKVVYIATSSEKKDMARQFSEITKDRMKRMDKLGIRTTLDEDTDAKLVRNAIFDDMSRAMDASQSSLSYETDIVPYGRKTNIDGVITITSFDLARLTSEKCMAPVPINNRDVSEISVSICKLFGNYELTIDGNKAEDLIFVLFSNDKASHAYLMAGGVNDIGQAIVRVGRDFDGHTRNKIGFDPLNIR